MGYPFSKTKTKFRVSFNDLQTIVSLLGNKVAKVKAEKPDVFELIKEGKEV